ncbi:MAG: hypothetical protein JO257_17435 [Deltaproteobacteria bacterium]|nr:hypothetical protein [Deltaproteobacteria bacterium]
MSDRAVTILHSGQTGVERGAHHGAIASGLPVRGFMRPEARDELGPLPQDVAGVLTPCRDGGQRAALLATLGLATAVVLVVPDIRTAVRRRTSTWVLRSARANAIPYWLCDAVTSVTDVASWYAQLASDAEHRILVTGPRATRWKDGEMVARRLVKSLALI